MKTKKLLLSLMTAVSVLLFNSCSEEDKCKDITCLNGGVCVDGVCINCDAGYEGNLCETVSRTKFLGTYSVRDSCTSSGISTYSITIDTSSVGIDKVLVSNFWDLFSSPVRASIDVDDITIPAQEPDNDGFWVAGDGTKSGNTINVTYVITDSTASPVDRDTCFSVWTKI
ncbi:MAG TPA: hypothetical protein VNJ07_08815 [Chitinophagales bacterium]|nr:hypothetical protein [Chitinophagales bacterium]